MTATLKKIIAEEIKNNVPYQDGKQACANLIIDVCKKQDKKWTQRKENNFLKACGLRS